MFNSRYSNFFKVLFVLAIIAIAALIIFLVYDLYKGYIKEKANAEAVSNFENSLDNNKAVNNATEIDDGVNNTTIDNSEEQSQTIVGLQNSSTTVPKGDVKLSGFTVIGVIEIPAINLKYSVLAELSPKALETSVCLVYGRLNQVGNSVIAGHNYGNGTVFSKLKRLSVGDTVYITDLMGNRVEYTIYNIYKTDGSDASYYNRDTQGKREVSLYTCTDDGKLRTTIWAKEK